MTQGTRVDSEIIRPTDAVAEPWANGLGVTRVLAATPDFRISIAEIDGRAGFSSLAGRDRLLVPLGEVVLRIGEQEHHLGPGEPIEFRGEDPVIGSAPSTPVRVVNVMTRRAAARVAWAIDDAEELGAEAVIVLDDRVEVAGERLAPGSLVRGGAMPMLSVPHGGLLRLRWWRSETDGGGHA